MAASSAISPGFTPRGRVSPSPNWPLSFSPQHFTSPAKDSAQVPVSPSDNAVGSQLQSALQPSPRTTSPKSHCSYPARTILSPQIALQSAPQPPEVLLPS